RLSYLRGTGFSKITRYMTERFPQGIISYISAVSDQYFPAPGQYQTTRRGDGNSSYSVILGKTPEIIAFNSLKLYQPPYKKQKSENKNPLHKPGKPSLGSRRIRFHNL
ncbi:MAG: hypothetical protein C0407_18560, partial [Desulfobacca sp.]|nr:hypothetical protein [Desulfobacca sp.]